MAQVPPRHQVPLIRPPAMPSWHRSWPATGPARSASAAAIWPAWARYLIPVLLPGSRDAENQPLELRARKVGAAVERLPVRRHEDRHRPAALTRHRLGGRHVDAVDVWPLLAVYLDADHDARSSSRPFARSRTTRAPSRGTSDTLSNRPTAAPVRRARQRRRTLRRPTATSRPGCRHAARGTDWLRREAALPCFPSCPAWPPRHRQPPAPRASPGVHPRQGVRPLLCGKESLVCR